MLKSKEIPHRDCATDASSDFSADCIKFRRYTFTQDHMTMMQKYMTKMIYNAM